MQFLTGKDYPHLCKACQSAIDGVATLFQDDLPDTDDVEAPCNVCYDHAMFCGGTECKNHQD